MIAKPLSTNTPSSFCTLSGTKADWEGVKGSGVPGKVSSYKRTTNDVETAHDMPRARLDVSLIVPLSNYAIIARIVVVATSWVAACQ